MNINLELKEKENPENIFKRVKKHLKEIQQKIDDYSTLAIYFDKEEKNLFEKLLNEFESNYERLIDIDRFSIPILGMVSSGKSTFLNFLLGIDYLELGHDITTKCVTIIRHKPIDNPEIYSVKIEERRKGYNFIKNERINGDPKTIISERNKFLFNNKECTNPEDFFILIEVRTHLFMGDNSEFSNLFEFLDIPGLNEGKKDSDDFRHSKFFKEQILPKIAENTQFSLFLFDAEKYLVKNNAEIYKDYINQFFQMKFINCFFILNKIDILKDKDNEIKFFVDDMLKNKLEVDLSKNYIDFVSSTQLTEEKEKDLDFQHYLNYIINQNTEKETNFLIHLITQLKKDYNIRENDLKTKISAPLPQELNEIKIILKEKFEDKLRKANFKKLLKPIDYKKYSEIYEKYHNKTNDEKSKKFSDLYNAFHKSFLYVIQNLNNITNNKDIQIKFDKLEKTIEKIPNNIKEEMNQRKIIIDEIYTGLTEKSRDESLNILNKLRPIIDDLYNLGPELEIFSELKKNFNILEHFIEKDRKIRIPFLGGYSTGKSSLLNCLIGKDILPTGSDITTNRGIVIRNNEQGKYILYKTKFIKKGDYYCFIEDGVIIESEENNYETIKNYLIEETKKNLNNPEDLFFILSVPLLLFKIINIDSNIKNRIELIDFPGIDVGNPIFEVDLFDPLINLCDSFIFINAYNLINHHNNIEIIQNIVSIIESRKINFEYSSCLFILTKSDEMEENLNLYKIKEQIENILFGDLKKGKIKFNFFQRFYKKQNQIEVTKFSSNYFTLYLENEKEIKNFKDFIQNQIHEIYREAEQEYKEVDNLIKELSESLDKYKNDNYEEIKNKELNPKEIKKYNDELNQILIKNKINQNEIEENKNECETIIQNYSYMLNNLNCNRNFISSNGNNLFQILEKKFKIANQMVNNQFNQKSKEQLKDLSEAFKLIHIRLTKNKTIDILENRKKMNDKLLLINEEYKTIINQITSKSNIFFQNYHLIINVMIENLDEENVDLSKIKEDISNIKNNYYKELSNLTEEIEIRLKSFAEFVSTIVEESEKEEIKDNEIGLPLKIGIISLIVVSSIIASIILTPIIFINDIISLGKIIINQFYEKENIKKQLEKLKKQFKSHEKQFNHYFYEPLGKMMEEATKKISLIYQSGEIVNKIEKEKFEQIYEKFKSILI